jgi:hypothetical protein
MLSVGKLLLCIGNYRRQTTYRVVAACIRNSFATAESNAHYIFEAEV